MNDQSKRKNMPFKIENLADRITEKRNESREFKEAWDSTHMDYRLIDEMVELRKKQEITQEQLVELTGCKLQDIVDIENNAYIPSLRVFCMILDTLGYKMIISKKQS